MTAPTIPAPGGGRASPPSPWFTRHTRGTIEAERDHRRGTHARSAGRQARRPGIAHPKLAAALAAQRSGVAPAPMRPSAWVDRGGRFDPEGAARLRIGDRSMKRCNA